jgi:hypothetical protein
MTGTPVSAPVMARAAFVTPRYPGRNNGLGLQTCLAQMSQLERNESDHFLSHVNRGLRLILGSLETRKASQAAGPESGHSARQMVLPQSTRRAGEHANLRLAVQLSQS